jgi:hypothetical protein
MIIVSQDKRMIINFDRINFIQFSKVSEKECIIEMNYGDCDTSIIAKYKTEERAKEVLQEIIDLISEDEFYHIKKSQLNSLDDLEEPKYIIRPVMKSKVYEMPKD